MSESRAVLERALAELRRRGAPRKIGDYFPNEGAFRRGLYPKHIDFFAAGAQFKERLFMAANRVGKSDAGAFEVTLPRDRDLPAVVDGPGVRSCLALLAYAHRDVFQRRSVTMITMTRTSESTAPTGGLLLAFELGQRSWKLGFTVGMGQRPRIRQIPATRVHGRLGPGRRQRGAGLSVAAVPFS